MSKKYLWDSEKVWRIKHYYLSIMCSVLFFQVIKSLTVICLSIFLDQHLRNKSSASQSLHYYCYCSEISYQSCALFIFQYSPTISSALVPISEWICSELFFMFFFSYYFQLLESNQLFLHCLFPSLPFDYNHCFHQSVSIKLELISCLKL